MTSRNLLTNQLCNGRGTPAHELEAAKVIADSSRAGLDAQVKQRDRLDTRTSQIVTSSGGLITVVGVMAAVLPSRDPNYKYPPWLALVLTVAIGCC